MKEPNRTEQELQEKIQQVLLQYMSTIHAELIHSHDDVFLANKILALFKEAGYVKIPGKRIKRFPRYAGGK